MGVTVTPSQKFLIFWLALIAGLAVGSKIDLPVMTLFWLLALWLCLLISGQQERVELISIIMSAFIGGLAVWQLTGGEIWFKAGFLQGIVAKLEQFRDTITDRIFLAMPEPHGSLLTGILLGNRVKLDRDLLETFRVVGLSHLIAVSGYNLSILTVNAQALLRPWLGRRAVFLSFALIVAFVILSGAPSSILRAAVMASALLLATYLGRPRRSINILIFAAGFLALFEPKIIFEIGFQLSIAATYALVRLAPVIAWSLERYPKIPETLRLIIAETLAATLMTAPILIAYFERISLVSPLSNLLVLPIMPILMGIGIAGTALVLLVPALGNLALMLGWPLLEWIIQVSHRLGGLEHAVEAASLPLWATVLIVVGMVVAVEWLFLTWRRRVPDIAVNFRLARI
ncbi:MAG: ComEC/Rec2 family competence protein [Candidatus Berkelbacteria bacterium]|nr:MAG: ComEC/Rec2 family competence protein [Candidatus Berkelbacteria bacterium]QQG51912.1 MAG: ComEC/Rec2 family competence protein [Candidatus Berkelbacteria bacterium]